MTVSAGVVPYNSFGLNPGMKDQSPSPIGIVTCPNCRVEMPRVSLRASETDVPLYEAVYRCPQCETETKRWITP
jgi:hypothetical protein